MSFSSQLSTLSTPRKVFLGAAALLLVDSFLPWVHASAGPISVDFNGWRQFGTLAWILLVALLAWEGARLTGRAPVQGRRADLASSVGALAVVAAGAIFCVQRLSDGFLGFGFWLGVLLLVALGVTAYGAFQASGGRDAVRREMDQHRQAPPAV